MIYVSTLRSRAARHWYRSKSTAERNLGCSHHLLALTVNESGTYDGAPVYDAIRRARPPRSPPKIVVPPSKASIPKPGVAHGGTERECHAADIAAHGRMAWQKNHA
ncbi:MAG: hypothetical protein AAFV49_20845, partial [Pseudomonadota bacterium]